MLEKCHGTVKLNFKGRYGNNLFIYFIGRIYAEENNLNLISNLESNHINIKPKKNFGVPNNNLKTYKISDNLYDKVNHKLPYYGEGNYIFDGYFQFEEIYYKYLVKMLIK